MYPRYNSRVSGTAGQSPYSLMHPPLCNSSFKKIPLSTFFPNQPELSYATYTPDLELPLVAEEVIVAGNLKLPKRKSIGGGATTPMSRHSESDAEEEIRAKRKEEAFKTALCDAYRKNNECTYGKQCRFAHGEEELRLPSQPRGKAHPKYKTQLCDKFSVNGFCPYGPRCQFIHMMKKGLPLVEYEKRVRAGKISPTQECVEFIDEGDLNSEYTRRHRRPFTEYQVDARRNSGPRPKDTRRRSLSDSDDSGVQPPQSGDYHRHHNFATTPKRAPRGKELSLIREESENHHDSTQFYTPTGHPSWLTRLMKPVVPVAATKKVAQMSIYVPSPRSRKTEPPAMEQIAEEEQLLLTESCDDELLTGRARVCSQMEAIVKDMRNAKIGNEPDRHSG